MLITLRNGLEISFESIKLYPVSLCLISNSILENTGSSQLGNYTFFGSPSWLVAGEISNFIFRQIDGKSAQKAKNDLTLLRSEALKNARFCENVTSFSGSQFPELSDLLGRGPPFDIFGAFPRQGLFDSGHFESFPKSREEAAKRQLEIFAEEYTWFNFDDFLEITTNGSTERIHTSDIERMEIDK